VQKKRKEPRPRDKPLDFHIEDFLIKDLMRENFGTTCEYCALAAGYAPTFNSLDKYAEHRFSNHRDEGSIYATPQDLKQARKKYIIKYKQFLIQRYKDNIKTAKAVIPLKEIRKSCVLTLP
jgi:hypothetical protein